MNAKEDSGEGDSIEATVLTRPGGKWGTAELLRLTVSLNRLVCSNGKHPEYIIIAGFPPRADIDKALKNRSPFEHSQVLSKKDLPYIPIPFRK